MASTATSSFQPDAIMDFNTESGPNPALAWSMIHWRNAGVMAWVVVVCLGGGAAAGGDAGWPVFGSFDTAGSSVGRRRLAGVTGYR